MNEIKFGNWAITPSGIEWLGVNEYIIYKDKLVETRKIGEVLVYDWPLHIVTKGWVNKEDLYAFNTAFIFALENFDIKPNENVSISTTLLAQQQEYDISH